MIATAHKTIESSLTSSVGQDCVAFNKKGGGSLGELVPGRTGKRSRCCGFTEVLGLSRAGLSGTKIGFRDFKMTVWSIQTSLSKWDPLILPGS